MNYRTLVLVLVAVLIGEAILGKFCWTTGGYNGHIAFYTAVFSLAISVGVGFAIARIDDVINT